MLLISSKFQQQKFHEYDAWFTVPRRPAVPAPLWTSRLPCSYSRPPPWWRWLRIPEPWPPSARPAPQTTSLQRKTRGMQSLLISSLFVCLFVWLFVCVILCLFLWLFDSLVVWFFVCLFEYLSVGLFVWVFVCWFVCLSICSLVCLFEYLSVGLFVWVFVRWFVCLSICSLVCLFEYLFVGLTLCLFVFFHLVWLFVCLFFFTLFDSVCLTLRLLVWLYTDRHWWFGPACVVPKGCMCLYRQTVVIWTNAYVHYAVYVSIQTDRDDMWTDCRLLRSPVLADPCWCTSSLRCRARVFPDKTSHCNNVTECSLTPVEYTRIVSTLECLYNRSKSKASLSERMRGVPAELTDKNPWNRQ